MHLDGQLCQVAQEERWGPPGCFREPTPEANRRGLSAVCSSVASLADGLDCTAAAT